MPLDLSVRPGESREQYTARINEEMKNASTIRRQDLKDGKVEVVLEVDDYGFLLPGHEDLLRLKKSFPDLKVTLFTIPLPKEFFCEENAKHFTWEKYRKWAEMVSSLDWIEIAVHGFSHTHRECECGYNKAVEMLAAVENVFKRVGLRHAKIFRAPYWQYSYDFLKALDDKGWTICIDRNHPRPVPKGVQPYVYQWSINEPFPALRSVVTGHAHFVGDNNNNINNCLGNLLKELPTQTKFIHLSEYVERQRSKMAQSPSDEPTGPGQPAEDGGDTRSR